MGGGEPSEVLLMYLLFIYSRGTIISLYFRQQQAGGIGGRVVS